ncbi:MAG: hypothetical protein IPM96_10360 [Ignavibacteria bacterium]|nr:hypothetical protein [Ignavibacteria bacterium]
MLLGVKENLREEAVAKGHRMRIYVPFGKDGTNILSEDLKKIPIWQVRF